MNSPYGLVVICRIALLLLLGGIFLVACVVIPQSMFGELMASGVAGFVLLMLIQLAFPWHRKCDLVLAALAGMFLMGVLRAALQGAPWLVLDAFALVAGIFVGNLGLAVERMRATARRYGNTTFEIIRIEEARSSRRQALRGSGARITKSPTKTLTPPDYTACGSGDLRGNARLKTLTSVLRPLRFKA
jgi:hypothetical protein